MPKPQSGFEKKVGDATLRLTAAHGWKKLTLEQVARAAKIPPAQLKKQAADKNDLLPLLARRVTAMTVAAAGKPARGAALHDRLFEIMMTRFDILQHHRKAVLSIMDAARCDSRMTCRLLPAQRRAMEDMLSQAGAGQEGTRQLLESCGLELVYLATLRVWRGDETLDMAKTMAALDRHLRWAGRLAEILFRTD